MRTQFEAHKGINSDWLCSIDQLGTSADNTGMQQKAESALIRAKQDTLSAFGTVRFWLFESLLVALLTIFVILWQPSGLKRVAP